MKKTCLVALFLIYSFLTFSQQADAPGVHFVKGTHQEALDLAGKNHQPLVVVFSAAWCGNCKKLKESTFTNPKVISYLNRQFVCEEIDAEKGEGKVLAKKYGVTSYPTIVVVDMHENALLTSEGYHEAGDLISTLMAVKASH